MVLGRKRIRRRPARAVEYPDDGPILLQNAWDQLSRIEFALWCRLAAEYETTDLSKIQLAQALKLSKRRLNELLRGLHHKGFVELIPVEGPGQSMRVMIARRPAVFYRSNFVNMHPPERQL